MSHKSLVVLIYFCLYFSQTFKLYISVYVQHKIFRFLFINKRLLLTHRYNIIKGVFENITLKGKWNHPLKKKNLVYITSFLPHNEQKN